jgi:hypothetical protein
VIVFATRDGISSDQGVGGGIDGSNLIDTAEVDLHLAACRIVLGRAGLAAEGQGLHEDVLVDIDESCLLKGRAEPMG